MLLYKFKLQNYKKNEGIFIYGSKIFKKGKA